MNKKILLFTSPLIVLLLIGVFYIKNNNKEYKKKYDIPANCELIQAFSYSGDIRACMEFNGTVPENATRYCFERLKMLPEYNKYGESDCKLVGMSSAYEDGNSLGCTEYCDFICCD